MSGLPGLNACPQGYRNDDLSILWDKWLGSGAQTYEDRNWLTEFQALGYSKSEAYKIDMQWESDVDAFGKLWMSSIVEKKLD